MILNKTNVKCSLSKQNMLGNNNYSYVNNGIYEYKQTYINNTKVILGM